MDKKRILIVAIVATIILFLFWNPMTRAAVLWLLPLGSGVDDAVFIGAAIVALVFWGFHLLKQRREK